MGDWVELRVHGVHGTSPASMLGVRDGDVGQVAGDGVTGIYRVRPETSVPLRTLTIPDDRPVPRRIAVEAYSWGALTSGVRGVLGWLRRLGWLLLLPFALANLAYWARLGVGGSGVRAGWGAKLIRLAGLALTVFMVLGPCVVAIDMVGWQCYRGGVPRCSNLPGQLGFLADWTAPQRLLLTSLLPVLVVLLLALLSRQTLNSYESIGPGYAVADTSDTDELLPVVRRPFLWSAADRTRRLQRLHVAAGLGAVVVFVAPQVLRVSSKANDLTLGGWHVVSYDRLLMASLALAAAVLLASALLVMVDHEQDLEYRGASSASGERQDRADGPLAGLRRRIEQALPLVAVLALVAQAWTLYRLRSTVSQVSTEYFGHNLWFVALFVLLTFLHLTVFVGERMSGPALVIAGLLAAVVVALVARLLWVDQHEGRNEMWWALAAVGVGWLLLVGWHYTRGSSGFGSQAWGGAGASVLLAAGAWIGLLFSSSLVTASANWLNGPDQSVADLVTATPDDAVDADTSYKFFGASGDVTLHHAKFAVVEPKSSGDEVVAGGVVIYSGTVTADRFNVVENNKLTSLRIGTTPVHQLTFLQLPKNADISFEQSCMVPDPDPQLTAGQRPRGDLKPKPVKGPCTANSAGYAAAGDIHVGGRTVTLVQGQGQDDATVAKHPKVTLVPQERIASAIVVPQVLVWTPLGQLLWLLIVTLALVAAVGVYSAKAGRAIRAGLPLLGGSPPDSSIPDEDRRACRSKRSAAGLAHRAEALLDVVGLFTAPLALAITVCALTGDAPWDRQGLGWTRGIATTAMYLMLLTAGGLLLLASHLRRSESARKAVGVIWDLATFWPRAAHPLAPPCYAERVVPELDTRVRWALGDPGNQVILSGHSQGSLIVASMVSRLENPLLGRVRLVTYGSQIRTLYGRIFPAVFGADAIGYDATTGRSTLTSGFPDVGYGHDEPQPPVAASLRGRVQAAGGHWVNLFRRSDPLGFRVFSDNDSSLDVPVPEVPTHVHGDPGPAVQGHSGYQHSPEYRHLVCGWTDEVEYAAVHVESSVIDVPLLPGA